MIGEPPIQDDATDASVGPSSTRRPSQATLLVALAGDVDLFHTPAGETYTTFAVGDHRETCSLRAKQFRHWLARRFYEQHGVTPNAQALSDALGVLEGHALFEGPEWDVHVRVAHHDNDVYIDLCDPLWRVVRVTAVGVDVINDPPVRFRRSPGMLPLPTPVHGDIELLRPFVNLAGDDDFTLLVAALVGMLSDGPYPITNFTGEQGSSKSTTSRVLRSLIDPNTAPLRSEPRNPHDLVIAANNAWTIAFDNLSSVPAWLSDGLCRLATGGGFATRELYSDSDEVIFEATRPIILNGISELATRSDLLDRALIYTLPPIPERRRKEETVFWQEFEAVRPAIIGSLFHAASSALRSDVQLHELPRMADFARWVARAVPAFGWEPQRFLNAYKSNREQVHDLALEGSALAECVRKVGEFEGTASELLQSLEGSVDEQIKRRREWPKSPSALSSHLRRLAPNLRAIGVNVEWVRDGRTRQIRIGPQNAVTGDNAVTTIAPELNPDDGDGDGNDGGSGIVVIAPGALQSLSDGNDGDDGNSRTHSAVATVAHAARETPYDELSPDEQREVDEAEAVARRAG